MQLCLYIIRLNIGVIKMKNIIVILIMIILSACSMDDRDSVVNLSEPPIPKIDVGGKQVPVLHTAYCWETDLANKCADFPQPELAFKEQTPVVVSPGDIVEIDFETHPPLTPITEVTLWQGKEIILQEPNVIEAPIEKGVYFYVFSARWQQGNSGFTFQIKVE
jgi:hypothetical protein